MADQVRVLNMELTAARCRQNILRMIRAAHHGHVGGAMSAMDVVTALYFDKMNVDPKDPKKPDRDRFILSAGHKCLCQYAALGEKGFFDKAEMDTYGGFKTHLPGHPDMHKLPGVEANTGALGHGMSIATGMAMASKLDKIGYRVYTVTGDGELPEGSNWEAAAAAAKFGLDNLTVFVDNNGLQISGRVTDVMNMEDIAEKFRSFGWAAEVVNGNDMNALLDLMDRLPLQEGKPTAVIMKTIKCKGLSFGEDNAAYHYWNPTNEDLDKADAEIAAQIEEITKRLEAAK